MYKKYIKSILDFILASFLFLFFLPLMMLIYILLFFQIRSPIFIQKRPGFKNKTIVIYKFKTIIDSKCKFHKKKNINKNFKFGLFLRNSGLDELPQLINILKGEISLVGPRPLRIKYLKISEFKNHVRSKCKPGITGLAQLESYNNVGNSTKSRWKKNFILDEFYYYNLSLSLDLKILYKTFIKFIKFSKKIDFIKETKPLKKHIS